jgi:hypothetical protein
MAEIELIKQSAETPVRSSAFGAAGEVKFFSISQFFPSDPSHPKSLKRFIRTRVSPERFQFAIRMTQSPFNVLQPEGRLRQKEDITSLVKPGPYATANETFDIQTGEPPP